MTTLILDTIARALDHLPLTQAQRAEIYHAWDVAPDVRPQTGAWYDDYFGTEAFAAWRRIREYHLHNATHRHLYTTLDEAAAGSACVTKADLLAALARAERMIAA